MLAKAYVLIEAEAGQLLEVLAALRSLPGIRTADVVTGPYDLIAIIETKDQRAIGRLVMDDLQAIVGIKRTSICVATV
jgi:DNA-binding Lrp family transcriptional regulator